MSGATPPSSSAHFPHPALWGSTGGPEERKPQSVRVNGCAAAPYTWRDNGVVRRVKPSVPKWQPLRVTG